MNGSNVIGVVHALNGTTSNFACAVSGTSPLTTSWELQTMSGEINRIGSTFSSLLTQDDEGIYTCVVVNEQEGLSDNSTVTVRVFGEHASVHLAQECAVVSYVYGNAYAGATDVHVRSGSTTIIIVAL